ncbi:MAG TPA: hypothetical protein VFQ59_02285 [Candidatus Paceibacterota bacterium]|nr:hypothetical protein [Candidatus Paceibacterota bacterium]
MNLKKSQSGFVLLFTTLLVSVILAVTIGTANIAYKEILFGTSAKDTNDAFFAADSGAECVLYHDRVNGEVFPAGGEGKGPIVCNAESIQISEDVISTNLIQWTFRVPGLGGDGAGCASVSITKDSDEREVVVVSKGYNRASLINSYTCEGPVERELELTYDF